MTTAQDTPAPGVTKSKPKLPAVGRQAKSLAVVLSTQPTWTPSQLHQTLGIELMAPIKAAESGRLKYHAKDDYEERCEHLSEDVREWIEAADIWHKLPVRVEASSGVTWQLEMTERDQLERKSHKDPVAKAKLRRLDRQANEAAESRRAEDDRNTTAAKALAKHAREEPLTDAEIDHLATFEPGEIDRLAKLISQAADAKSYADSLDHWKHIAEECKAELESLTRWLEKVKKRARISDSGVRNARRFAVQLDGLLEQIGLEASELPPGNISTFEDACRVHDCEEE